MRILSGVQKLALVGVVSTVAALASLAIGSATPAVTGGQNGKIVFTSISAGRSTIEIVDADGHGRRRLAEPAAVNLTPVWSPDGNRIAYTCGNFSICTMNVDGSWKTRLTNTGSWNGKWVFDLDPAWSPDGKEIVFGSNRGGKADLYIVGSDGTRLRRFGGTSGRDREPAWSPDGSTLAFESDLGGSNSLYLANADHSGRRKLIEVVP